MPGQDPASVHTVEVVASSIHLERRNRSENLDERMMDWDLDTRRKLQSRAVSPDRPLTLTPILK
jgi:hypothetical protein